jgi:hypothetical protein
MHPWTAASTARMQRGIAGSMGAGTRGPEHAGRTVHSISQQSTQQCVAVSPSSHACTRPRAAGLRALPSEMTRCLDHTDADSSGAARHGTMEQHLALPVLCQRYGQRGALCTRP